MSTNTKVVFANGQILDVQGYSVGTNLISIHYDSPVENLSGFCIYEGKDLVFDGSEHKYRWDVVDQRSDRIYYTNDPDYRQTKPFPDLGDVQEPAEPLTNEELTEAVADLMYEMSLSQLGI